jgi:hypothetical protein
MMFINALVAGGLSSTLPMDFTEVAPSVPYSVDAALTIPVVQFYTTWYPHK